MKIITGKQERYQKIVVYGPEGIGKSTFAAHFPKPLFIDTEASTAHMNVRRLGRYLWNTFKSLRKTTRDLQP